MSRAADILAELAGVPTPEYLAEKLGISQRTLASDISSLNNTLTKVGQIRLRNSRYHLLIHDPQGFAEIRDRISHGEHSFNNPDRRISYLVWRLLGAPTAVTIDALAGEMGVSRTTAIGDLTRARHVFSQLNVQIQGRPRIGLLLAGDEVNIRLSVLEHGDFFHDAPPDIAEAVDKIARVHGLGSTDVRLAKRWVTVALKRYSAGFPVGKLSEDYQELRGGVGAVIAQELVDEISQTVGISLPDEEMLFLASRISGMRTSSPKGLKAWEVRPEAREIVVKVFEQINLEMDLNLAPEALLEQFTHHVSFMLNRLRYRTHVPGPQFAKDQFLQQYPVAHRMASIAASVIGKELDLEINDSEQALLTVYFQVFLEDHTNHGRLRVAIVSNDGPAVLRLTLMQLSRVFPDSTQFEMLDGQAPRTELDACDLVVVTAGTQVATTAPILALSNRFDDTEVARQLSRVPTLAHSHPATQVGATITSMVDAERFLVLPAGCNYSMACDLMTRHLIGRGLLPENFVEDLNRREARATMRLDDWIGFPHVAAHGVTGIVSALGVAPTPADEPGIRLVFLLAVGLDEGLDDSLLIRSYSDLIRLGDDKGLVAKISQTKSYSDLFYLIADQQPLGG